MNWPLSTIISGIASYGTQVVRWLPIHIEKKMRILLTGVLVLTLVGDEAWAQRPRKGNRRDQQADREALERDAALLLQQFDKNRDGMLSGNELPRTVKRRLARLDSDGDGNISKAELMSGKSRGRLGEIDTGPARDGRRIDTLKVGDIAPDFTLQDPTGKRTVTLSQFRGKKPVVLIFGSYT